MFDACVLWLVLVGWTVSVSECSLTISGWFSWTPPGSTRTDLYCLDECQPKSWKEECCSCGSSTCYEMNPRPAGCNDTIANVTLEYINLAHDSMITDVRLNETNATYFNLVHTNGKMTSLPVNICDFPNIIRIEVRGNHIESIGNISCVHELNYLDLSKNSITSVSNETFTHMTQLRFVNLSSNAIDVLEPNTFLKHGGNIFTVDMSFINLQDLDVSNVVVEGPFCDRLFRNSTLEEPSNKYGFKIDKSKHYGPGEIDYTNSTLGHFLNFTHLGIDYADMELYTSIGFHQNSFNLKCDCHLVPYLQVHSFPGILRFMPQLADGIVCHEPAHMKGIALNALNYNDKLDILTCQLTEFCHPKCTCTDLQSQKRVLVNCTNAGLTKLPDYMPVGSWNSRKLHLIMDGNNIDSLGNREYLNRVDNLSLSGNPIQDISDATISMLPDDLEINLSHSNARKLPKTLQKKNPNRITFGRVPILCDCSNVWIGAWLRSYDAYNKLECEIDGQVVKAEGITDEMLDCTHEEGLPPLAVALAVIFTVLCAITISTTLYLTRFELLILRRRLMQWVRGREHHLPEMLYHLYVIFDEENDEPLVTKTTTATNICEWIRCRLKPYLDKEGLDNYVPYLDIQLGTDVNKEDQLYQATSDSEAFVVIYTDKFFDRSDTRRQFESVWTQFKKYPHKSIIVINFDSSITSEVPDRRMRALFRVGYFLDYAITTTRMVDRLVQRYHAIYQIDKTGNGVKGDVKAIHPEPGDHHIYPRVALSPANREFDASIFKQNPKANMQKMQAASNKEHGLEGETKTNANLPIGNLALIKRTIGHHYLKRTPKNCATRVPIMGLDSKESAKQQLDVLHDDSVRVSSAKSSSSIASFGKVPLQFTVSRSREPKSEPLFNSTESVFSVQMGSKGMSHAQWRLTHGSIPSSEEHLRAGGNTTDNVQRHGPASGFNRGNQSYDRVTSVQSQSSISTTLPAIINRGWSSPTKDSDRSQLPIAEIETFNRGRFDDTILRTPAGNRWMTATPVIHSDDRSPSDGNQHETSVSGRYGTRNETSYSRYNY